MPPGAHDKQVVEIRRPPVPAVIASTSAATPRPGRGITVDGSAGFVGHSTRAPGTGRQRHRQVLLDLLDQGGTWQDGGTDGGDDHENQVGTSTSDPATRAANLTIATHVQQGISSHSPSRLSSSVK